MVLFASDYDGTIKRNNEISETDLAQIAAFRNKGHKFGIVTGRTIDMICGELDYYKLKVDFVIGTNGGILVDGGYNVLATRHIETEYAFELVNEYKNRPEIMFGISNGVEYGRINDGNIDRNSDNEKKKNKLIFSQPIDADIILEKGVINSFFIRMQEQEDTLKLFSRLEKNYDGRISFHYNNGTVDGSAFGVSKVSGVRLAAEHFGAKNIYVAGDGYNDISMLKEFGGFSVDSADKDVKKHASKVFDAVGSCLKYVLSNC